MPYTNTNENKLYRENSIRIIGTLAKVDVKTGTRTDNGQEYVSVNATINSVIGGKTNEYDVSFFSSRLTKDGKENQLYVSYLKMNELVNKRVDVSGEIRENRYWSNNANQMVSAQLLSGRFIRAAADTTADSATFILGGVVLTTLKERVNKAGEIYRYDISIGQSNYKGDNMSQFTLHVNPEDREIISGVEGYECGMTVKLSGNLDFTIEQVTVQDNNTGFGQSVAKTYTNRQRNFFIKGGSNPIDDESAYSAETVKTLVANYKAAESVKASAAKEQVNDQPVEKTVPLTRRQTSLL